MEVYGDEWSYAYYTDAPEDPSVSGVSRNVPRDNPCFDYKYPIYMGKTKKSSVEVAKIFLKMSEEWPSIKYHITENNCVDFAVK